METETKKRAVIYCRVSTKEQAKEGGSLLTQKRACTEYAEDNGYEIIETFIEEGESAKTQNRTQLKRLMSFCADRKNNVHAVIAYKIDRISRNMDDYSYLRLYFKKHKVEIKSTSEAIEDNPAGRFMENMLANVAQFDNDVRTERSVNGMRDAVREGRHIGKAPYGYSRIKIDKKANIIPNEDAPLVRKLFAEVAKNDRSIAEIRLEMHKAGMLHKGKPFGKSQFYRLLQNEVYCGWIVKFGERNKGSYEPLVSELLFERVQSVLKRRSHKSFIYQRENPDFPLRRFVFHPNGAKLTGYWAQGKKNKYPYYRFKGVAKTDFLKDRFEKRYMAYMSKYGLTNGAMQKLKGMLVERFDRRITEHMQLGTQLKARIADLETKQGMLIDKNLKGVINDAILQTQLAVIDDQLNDLKGQLLRLPSKHEKMERYFAVVEEFLKDPGKIWAKSSNQKRLRLQWFEFPHGIVLENEKFRTQKVASVFNVKSGFATDLSRSVRRTRRSYNQPEITIQQYAQEIKELAGILSDPENT